VPRIKELREDKLIALRLSTRLHEQVSDLALRHERSLSAEIRHALKSHVRELRT
jgi:predicted HicB family RNase H-like nuclease